MIKLLVLEEESEIAEELWNAAASKIASQLIYPEARAALAAAARAGRIDERDLRQTLMDLEDAIAAIRRIGVDEVLAREAGQLAELHALRGYDAVYLATAMGVADPDLIVVTWDHDLAAAALACGLAAAPALPD